MARLPMEIWREIFSYSCTDGGYTGTSLALACKLFYNASLPVRFYSLSLFSLRQVELFLAFARQYEHRYDGRRLRIHHLLLSFPSSPPSDCSSELSSDGSSSETCDPAQQWIAARRLRDQDKAAWDHRFFKVVPVLLELAAPHLQTLALLQSDGFVLPTIRQTLPRLRELTLLVGISVMINDDDAFDAGRRSSPPPPPTPGSSPAAEAPASATPSTPPRFPALERLHVVCGRHRDFVLGDTLAHLPRLAPGLTHLRVSNATYTHAHCLPAFLRDALGLPQLHPDSETASGAAAAYPAWLADAGAGADGDDDTPRARPPLRRVLVHSVPPPSAGTCGRPHKEYSALVGAVNAIGAACDAVRDVRVRTLCGARAKQRYWERLVEGQWRDRIEGGDGCWEGCGDREDAAAREYASSMCSRHTV